MSKWENNKLQPMAAKLCFNYTKRMGWYYATLQEWLTQVHPSPGLYMTGQSLLTKTEGLTHHSELLSRLTLWWPEPTHVGLTTHVPTSPGLHTSDQSPQTQCRVSTPRCTPLQVCIQVARAYQNTGLLTHVHSSPGVHTSEQSLPNLVSGMIALKFHLIKPKD